MSEFNILSLISEEFVSSETKEGSEESRKKYLAALIDMQYNIMKKENIPVASYNNQQIKRYVSTLSDKEVIKMIFLVNTMMDKLIEKTGHKLE